MLRYLRESLEDLSRDTLQALWFMKIRRERNLPGKFPLKTVYWTLFTKNFPAFLKKGQRLILEQFQASKFDRQN